MESVDLSGGELKATGNFEDEHTFRLSNPSGQSIINSGGTYEAEFSSHLGSDPVPVTLDTSEVATGSLIFTLIVINGKYIVRSLTPKRRTLLTISVEQL